MTEGLKRLIGARAFVKNDLGQKYFGMIKTFCVKKTVGKKIVVQKLFWRNVIEEVISF